VVCTGRGRLPLDPSTTLRAILSCEATVGGGLLPDRFYGDSYVHNAITERLYYEQSDRSGYITSGSHWEGMGGSGARVWGTRKLGVTPPVVLRTRNRVTCYMMHSHASDCVVLQKAFKIYSLRLAVQVLYFVMFWRFDKRRHSYTN
jgi:hypothetical protein